MCTFQEKVGVLRFFKQSSVSVLKTLKCKALEKKVKFSDFFKVEGISALKL